MREEVGQADWDGEGELDEEIPLSIIDGMSEQVRQGIKHLLEDWQDFFVEQLETSSANRSGTAQCYPLRVLT